MDWREMRQMFLNNFVNSFLYCRFPCEIYLIFTHQANPLKTCPETLLILQRLYCVPWRPSVRPVTKERRKESHLDWVQPEHADQQFARGSGNKKKKSAVGFLCTWQECGRRCSGEMEQTDKAAVCHLVPSESPKLLPAPRTDNTHKKAGALYSSLCP